jgi:hypothetical protein
MKLAHIIDALRSGATLHHSLVKGPHWELHDKNSIRTVSSRAVQALLRRGVIEPTRDSLLTDDVPSQTWRAS